MSKIEVDQVDPQSGTTLTLGTSGDTVSIPSGVTLANSGTMTGVPVPTTGIAASAISSGTIATARLGSGTASSSTFLRGDQTYADPGGGITGADQWRQTANLAGNAVPITANLERNDTAGYGSIGSAMTVSSGIFTFPSTGIWRVEAVFAFYSAASTDGNMYGYIQSTQNNSSYIDQVELHMFAAANDHGTDVSGYFMFDVTDTSTHKVRFLQNNFGNAGDISYGSTDRNMTYFTFTRLGDT